MTKELDALGIERGRTMDPSFWAKRLAQCNGELHRSIFNGSVDQIRPFEQRAQRDLKQLIGTHDSVLDAGCGYGRLLPLMPDHWQGSYLGIDICPEFIHIARMLHPTRQFRCADLLTVFRDRVSQQQPPSFDVCVVMSLRDMIVRNCGDEVWSRILAELQRVSQRIIYLSLGEHD